MGIKGDSANLHDMPWRCSREVEDASVTSRFAITTGVPAGLVSFDRCIIIHSCAKLHWEGDEALLTGGWNNSMNIREEQIGGWIRRPEEIRQQNYNIYIESYRYLSLHGNQLLEGTQILEKSSGQRGVGWDHKGIKQTRNIVWLKNDQMETRMVKISVVGAMEQVRWILSVWPWVMTCSRSCSGDAS